jgi:hypothetical protein
LLEYPVQCIRELPLQIVSPTNMRYRAGARTAAPLNTVRFQATFAGVYDNPDYVEGQQVLRVALGLGSSWELHLVAFLKSPLVIFIVILLPP